MSRNHEDDADQLPDSSRRTFCTELMLTSAGLVLAGSHVTKVTAAQNSIAYPPRRIDGAELLMPGSNLYFNYPTRNDPAVLFRSSDGEFRAYSRRCPHAGCSLDVDATSRCLTCPCHRGTFDTRMGQVMFGPPRRSLDTIILQVRAGGQLWAIGKGFGGEAEIVTETLGGGDRNE